MNNATTIESNRLDAQTEQAQIEQMFVEMEQTDEREQRRRERIDRLQTETRAIIAAIRAKP